MLNKNKVADATNKSMENKATLKDKGIKYNKKSKMYEATLTIENPHPDILQCEMCHHSVLDDPVNTENDYVFATIGYTDGLEERLFLCKKCFDFLRTDEVSNMEVA